MSSEVLNLIAKVYRPIDLTGVYGGKQMLVLANADVPPDVMKHFEFVEERPVLIPSEAAGAARPLLAHGYYIGPVEASA